MNVRRGLFRAWVAVSCLWVVGVAWLAYSQLNDHHAFDPERLYYNVETGEMGWGVPSRWHREADTVRSPWVADDTHVVIQMEGGAHVVVAPVVAEDYPENPDPRVNQHTLLSAYDAFLRQERYRASMGWLLVAGVPPVVLLLLGLVALWIARGFRAL